jgi:tetratricopeptide (TPR) repeat protein
MERKFIGNMPLHYLASAVLFAAICGVILFHTQLSRLSWEHGRFFPIAMALNWTDANLSMEIGDYYFNGGAYNLNRASFFYRQALLLDPLAPRAHYQLGRIYFIRGLFARSLEELDRELTHHPLMTRAHYMHGLSNGMFGRTEAAVADFTQFIRFHPTEWAGYNDLMWVEMQGGRYEDAHHTASDAFAAVPGAADNPWLWNSKGVAELNLGDTAAAANSFLRAQALSKQLTQEVWLRAYPGNDPAAAIVGLEIFRSVIEQNLAQTADLNAQAP